MDEIKKLPCIECKLSFDKLELNKSRIYSTPAEMYICNHCIKNTSHALDIKEPEKKAEAVKAPKSIDLGLFI